MSTPTIISTATWTCLPNGVSAKGQYQMSVLVTPSFKTSGTIGSTSFADWPSKVAQIAWTVVFDQSHATNVSCVSSLGLTSLGQQPVTGSALWGALFPASTPVTAATALPSVRNVNSYGAIAVGRAIKDAYRHVARTSPRGARVDRSKNDPFNATLREATLAENVLHRVAPAVGQARGGSTHSALLDAYRQATGRDGGVGYEFARHGVFYDRGSHRSRARLGPMATGDAGAPPMTPPPAPTLPTVDFASMLGQLGDHYDLLRALGIIVDLVFTPPPGVVASANNPVVVFVDPGSWWGTDTVGGAPAGQTFQPRTAVTMSASVFCAYQQDPSSMTAGQLPLSQAAVDSATASGQPTTTNANAVFAIETVDIEGSAMKLAGGTTQTLDGEQAPLPALRSAGFTILNANHATNVSGALQRQASYNDWCIANQDGSAVQLTAESLVRGYRVEVGRNGGPLKSLCSRNSIFGVAGVPFFELQSEGFVKGTAASTPYGANEYDLHEALFGWEGWSLVAQRPGGAITSGGTPSAQTETPVQPMNVSPAGNLEIAITPQAGTLTALRFGSSYQFNARLVDLAGNDMSKSQSGAGTNAASQAVPYVRWEPVAPPTLVPQHPVTEGEHVERLVIRSNPYGIKGSTPSTYATIVTNAQGAAIGSTIKLPSGASVSVTSQIYGTCARWVAAPKASWSMAEQHGMFDAFIHSMAANPAGATAVGTAFTKAKLALYALSLKEAGTFLDGVLQRPAYNAPPVINPVVVCEGNAPVATQPSGLARGSQLPPGQYVTLPGPSVSMPYLPDPNARGIVILQPPAAAGALPSVLTTLDWAPATTGWAPPSVWPAPVGTAAAWPNLPVAQLVLTQTLVGVTGYQVSAGSTSSGPQVTVALSPGQQVTLEYASTLVSAAPMALAPAAGESGANVDDGQHGMLTPPRTLTLIHATQMPMAPTFVSGGGVSFTVGVRQPGQTAAPITGVIYGVDGLNASHLELRASWTEYVDTETTTGVTVDALSGVKTIAREGRVQTFSLATTDDNVPMFASAPVMQEFGDTKARTITYRAIATSRFREYFPPEITSDPANITATAWVPAPIVVPASARPPAPKVLFVVPTYGWPSATTSGATTTKLRTGGGLRIYVDRFWFASGEGELLGVLLNDPTSTGPAPADYVSQWGLDPTWNAQESAPLPTLTPANFLSNPTGPFGPTANVPTAEGAGQVQVLGYAPTYNPALELWYFDVELTQDALDAPFVRLALARYQATALDGLHLSTVVRADMAKLASDRTATYTTNTDGSVDVTISGSVFGNEPPSGSTVSLQARGEKTPETGPISCMVSERLGIQTTGCPGGGGPGPAPQPPAPKYPGYVINKSAGSGHVVVAQLQEATNANPQDFDWVNVGSAVPLDPCQGGITASASTLLFYKGHVPMPSTGAPPTGVNPAMQHRLLIQEWEVFFTDAETADGNDFVAQYASAIASATRGRVTFSDTLLLPPA